MITQFGRSMLSKHPTHSYSFCFVNDVLFCAIILRGDRIFSSPPSSPQLSKCQKRKEYHYTHSNWHQLRKPEINIHSKGTFQISKRANKKNPRRVVFWNSYDWEVMLWNRWLLIRFRISVKRYSAFRVIGASIKQSPISSLSQNEVTATRAMAILLDWFTIGEARRKTVRG